MARARFTCRFTAQMAVPGAAIAAPVDVMRREGAA